MLDRWLRLTEGDLLTAYMAAASLALTVWALWPFFSSDLAGMLVGSLIACFVAPLVALVVVGPVFMAISLICIIADGAIAVVRHYNTRRRRRSGPGIA